MPKTDLETKRYNLLKDNEIMIKQILDKYDRSYDIYDYITCTGTDGLYIEFNDDFNELALTTIDGSHLHTILTTMMNTIINLIKDSDYLLLIQNLNENYIISPQLLKAYRKNYKLFLNKYIDICLENKKLKEQINDLEIDKENLKEEINMLNEHIKFSPFGEGYEEAKQHFITTLQCFTK